MMVTNLTIKGQ